MADEPFSLFYLPFRPALDANGIVVPGASLTFYLSGTNTLQAVYADAALTTPLANPLTANAAGKWPAIYINTSLTYRVVLRGQLGETLESVDPYKPGMVGGPAGETGLAANTFETLATLKAADTAKFKTANLTQPGIAGSFVWTVGDFTGLTDDAIFVASDVAPVTQGTWVKQTSEAVSAAAIVPGQGDNGPSLQALLNAAAGKAIRIPARARPYTVGAALRPPSNTVVQIEAGATFVPVGALAASGEARGFFDVSNTIGVKLTVFGQGEATFRAAPFDAALAAQPVQPNLYIVYAANPGSQTTRDLTVRDLMGVNVQHVHILRSAAYADIITPRTNPTGHTCNARLRIIRGGAVFDVLTQGDVACMFRFAFDVKVNGSTYRNVGHGVAWWGGNAALDADGAVANERKCGDFEITGVTVDGTVSGGGVWGSMGTDGRVLNCTVLRSGDVGFDPEGSNNIDFIGCRAEDCGLATGGANFAVFFACNGIAFISCVSIARNPLGKLFETFNVTQIPLGGDILISGGYWASYGPNGQGPGLIRAAGAQRKLTIKGITGRNVTISATGNNNNQVTIADCDLSFDRFINSGAPAIIVSGVHAYADGRGMTPATVSITNNDISSQADQVNTGSVPIIVEMDDFNNAGTTEISNNRVSGGWRSYDMILRFRGQNAGQVTVFNVFNNLLRNGGGFDVGTIVNDSGGAAATAILNRDGNRAVSGMSLDPAPPAPEPEPTPVTP